MSPGEQVQVVDADLRSGDAVTEAREPGHHFSSSKWARRARPLRARMVGGRGRAHRGPGGGTADPCAPALRHLVRRLRAPRVPVRHPPRHAEPGPQRRHQPVRAPRRGGRAGRRAAPRTLRDRRRRLDLQVRGHPTRRQPARHAAVVDPVGSAGDLRDASRGAGPRPRPARRPARLDRRRARGPVARGQHLGGAVRRARCAARPLGREWDRRRRGRAPGPPRGGGSLAPPRRHQGPGAGRRPVGGAGVESAAPRRSVPQRDRADAEDRRARSCASSMRTSWPRRTTPRRGSRCPRPRATPTRPTSCGTGASSPGGRRRPGVAARSSDSRGSGTTTAVGARCRPLR